MRRALAFGAIALLAASAFVAPPAAAHEPWTYGYGSRGASMGGAQAADVRDFSANYYNPAGLADELGIRVGVGYFYADNNLRVNDKNSGVNASHGVTFGLAAAGDVFGLPIAIGIATFVPDEGLSRITALRQDVPRWELYDNRSSVLYLAANLAIRPWDFLEVGGGLSFLAATRGRFEISGIADISFPYQSKLRHEVDVDLTSVRYPQVGALVHLAPNVSMGLVYRGQTNLDLQLDGRIDADLNAAGLLVPIVYELQARTVQAFLPQQLVLGASWKPHPTVTVNADVTWVNWGAYKNPTAQTVASLRAQIPPGFSIELPEDVRNTELSELHFSDRIVPRLGVEWYLPGFKDKNKNDIVRIPLRIGYFYEKSPVPAQAALTNFVDSDRHTGSFGVGVEVPLIHLGLDVHGAISGLPERITLKRSPADLVGDYRVRGEMLNIGATLTGNFK